MTQLLVIYDTPCVYNNVQGDTVKGYLLYTIGIIMSRMTQLLIIYDTPYVYNNVQDDAVTSYL